MVASDHRGLDVKRAVIETLAELGIPAQDLGPADEASVDYPDYALSVAESVGSGRAERGVLVCGSGIGMSIAANKVAGVRAALVRDERDAEMSRRHNDANVLVLGADGASLERVRDIVRVWWRTPFEGGRHARRVEKISEIERAGRDEKK